MTSGFTQDITVFWSALGDNPASSYTKRFGVLLGVFWGNLFFDLEAGRAYTGLAVQQNKNPLLKTT